MFACCAPRAILNSTPSGALRARACCSDVSSLAVKSKCGGRSCTIPNLIGIAITITITITITVVVVVVDFRGQGQMRRQILCVRQCAHAHACVHVHL